jgi:type III secretory pathway component EscV
VYESLNRWAESTPGIIVVGIVGGAGLVLGIISSMQAAGRSRIVWAGLLLNFVGIVMGFPMLMFYLLLGGTW